MSIIQKILLPFRVSWSLLTAYVMKFFPPRPKDIRGKVVIISGGAGGIGQELAYKFASYGARVALVDLNEKGMLEVKENVEKKGVTCRTYRYDISNREDVAKLGADVRRDFETVDILVNNAGIAHLKDFLDLKDSEIRKIIDVNLFGTIWMTREFLPDMAARNDGHIVSTCSVLGYSVHPKFVDYCASKYGVNGFCEALATSLESSGKAGVHVTIAYPEAVDTPLIARFSVPRNVLGQLLRPDFTAEKITEGVLANQRHVYIPRNGWRLGAMINLFPVETMKIIGDSKKRARH